ncbi:MAG: N-acetylmuramoyl-L-alanine amidase [Kiritimatiellae bacterium]|nr:N-acetylmuramoyl-L-alanine amidase [Kiritimatiellia bacterium]
MFFPVLIAMMSLFGTNEPPQRVYSRLEYSGEKPHVILKTMPPLVYLDPGHGGEKGHGCQGYDGRFESEANLLLALDVKAALERGGVQVLMTRDADVDVPLYERARHAHAIKADCFVSLHHNAPAPGKDVMTRYRAVYSWNDLGKSLADQIAVALEPCQSLHANFAVTRSDEIASVLVEADFLTHPDGCRDAFDPVVRGQIANQIASGILAWRQAQEE